MEIPQQVLRLCNTVHVTRQDSLTADFHGSIISLHTRPRLVILIQLNIYKGQALHMNFSKKRNTLEKAAETPYNMPRNATKQSKPQLYFLRPSVPFLIIFCLLASTSLSKISRAVSPFFRFEGLDFTLTVAAPPLRICFSASSQAAEPPSIAYLEARNQLLFIRTSQGNEHRY